MNERFVTKRVEWCADCGDEIGAFEEAGRSENASAYLEPICTSCAEREESRW